LTSLVCVTFGSALYSPEYDDFLNKHSHENSDSSLDSSESNNLTNEDKDDFSEDIHKKKNKLKSESIESNENSDIENSSEIQDSSHFQDINLNLRKEYRNFNLFNVRNKNSREYYENLIDNELPSDLKQLDQKENVKVRFLFNAAITYQWHEVNIIVKVLLVNNYKHVQKVIIEATINNKEAKHNDLLKLENQLFKLYNNLKRNIIQAVQLAKTKFKSEIRKIKFNVHKVIQTVITQIAKLKEEINIKVQEFKQNIARIIDEFQSKFKPIIHQLTTELPLNPSSDNSTDIEEPDLGFTENPPAASNIPGITYILVLSYI
jgi:hypothetical protein